MSGGTPPRCSDDEFIRLVTTLGPQETARRLNTSERAVYKRRNNLERYHGSIPSPSRHPSKEYPYRQQFDVKNGCVIVASDLHIWPDVESTALRALKKLAGEMEPVGLILNGDILDFPQISRHPPIGWEKFPEVKAELEAAQDHLSEIEKVLKRGCHKIWPMGNHDARFESRLASVAREYKGINGIHLADHFPTWKKAWSCWINDSVVIKHRFKGGVHATHNGTLWAGKTMITGHLHSQKVTPFTDYNGTRYGVDTGCVADTDHQAFNYLEDNPVNWRSGFCVLTFRDGQLLHPELVTKWDEDSVQWRGKIIKV